MMNTEKQFKSWAEASEADDALSPFLRFKVGDEHIVSVCEVKHLEKDIQVWEKGQPVDGQKRRAVVTQLSLDMVDGKPSSKVFEVVSKNLREIFREYDVNNGLTKWTWKIKRGEKEYQVFPVKQKVNA
jgi:hypothetical protein